MSRLAALTLIALTGTSLSVSAQVWTRDSSFHPVLRDDIPALNNAHFTAASSERVLLFGAFTHLQNNAFASP